MDITSTITKNFFDSIPEDVLRSLIISDYNYMNKVCYMLNLEIQMIKEKHNKHLV
jgi:hypothetical protein